MNDLMGAADGAFLNIFGRDQADQTLYLNGNEETLIWDLDKAEMETFKSKPDPVIEAVAWMIKKNHPCWCGTATELVEALGLALTPNKLTMKLNISVSHLLNDFGIRYTNIRNHAGRQVSLELTEDITA